MLAIQSYGFTTFSVFHNDTGKAAKLISLCCKNLPCIRFKGGQNVDTGVTRGWWFSMSIGFRARTTLLLNLLRMGLLRTNKTTIHFVSPFIFQIVNPCEVEITEALICTRKQFPEGCYGSSGKMMPWAASGILSFSCTLLYKKITLSPVEIIGKLRNNPSVISICSGQKPFTQ